MAFISSSNGTEPEILYAEKVQIRTSSRAGLLRIGRPLLVVSCLVCVGVLTLRAPNAATAAGAGNFAPGARVVLNAHNCYPYEGKHHNRIDRALSTGLPVSIELDLAWHNDPVTEKAWSVLSHETKTHGDEPTLESYFFAKVKPIIEREIEKGDAAHWPAVYLHFNFKTFERAHVEHVHQLLLRHRSALSFATRSADSRMVSAIRYRPLLVMTETNETEKQVFHDSIPAGQPFYVFGSAPGEAFMPEGLSREEQRDRLVKARPEEMLVQPADNYRRWWNNPWAVVERGGPPLAGQWTPQDEARLNALVKHAHGLGYMIRFYTLNGHAQGEGDGWGNGYNFGSLKGAKTRWKAAIASRVDFIATDQYELLNETMAQYSR